MTGKISDETYEKLRQILERQHKRPYTLQEAKEIGDGLIEFFDILADTTNELEDVELPDAS